MTCCKQCGEEVPADTFFDDPEFCSDECLDAYLDQPLNLRRGE